VRPNGPALRRGAVFLGMSGSRTGIVVAVSTLAVGAASVCALALSPVEGQQVFRSTVDAVIVPVTVKSGNRMVSGLKAEDFELRDNSVPQEIRGAPAEKIPIDVTLLLDVSASVDGPMVERLKTAVRDTAGLLRDDDRIRLISVSQVLHTIFDFRPPGAVRIDALGAEGATSLYDGLAAAMMRPSDAARRHLIVAFTDGRDSTSITDERVVKEIARLTDAVVDIVVPVIPVGGIETPRLSQRAGAMDSLMSGSNVTRPGEVKGSEDMPPVLVDLVAPTGGQVVRLLPGDSISRSFRAMLEDFRAAYVLQYTPRGVAPGGWHDVDVTLKRGGRFEVRARKGYMRREG
jgi:VWFA-related protein